MRAGQRAGHPGRRVWLLLQLCVCARSDEREPPSSERTLGVSPLGFMPARRTPDQYAAVAAAGDPPRADESRFAGNEDAWHDAQDDWHAKVREAFCHDELPPRGISDRRKAWQAAIKQAASFAKKLADDPSLAQPPEDDGRTQNERRTEQRREQRKREHRERTAYERRQLEREMREKPFSIHTLYAFSDDDLKCYDWKSWNKHMYMCVSPEGVVCVESSTHDWRTPRRHHKALLVLISPGGERQGSFVVDGIIAGLACTSDTIFVSGVTDGGGGCVRKFGFDGSLLDTHELEGAGPIWLIGDLLYGVGRGLFLLNITDLQQVGGFRNITPKGYGEPDEPIPLWKVLSMPVTGEPESIGGLAACGDELFISSTPHNFRGESLRREHINVFTHDGSFLRHLKLHCPGLFMAASSVNYGPVLVSIHGNPCRNSIYVYALDGRMLHSIRFASEPLCAAAVGNRVFVATRAVRVSGTACPQFVLVRPARCGVCIRCACC